MSGFALHRNFLPRVVSLLLPLLCLSLAACERANSNKSAALVPAPAEVTIANATAAAIPLRLSYAAQTAGSRDVEVRARVSGILLKRYYQEGSTVKQGEVLFEIDPAPFEAAVAQDRAALAVARANLMQSQRNRDRIVPLVEKGLASTKERDDVVSTVEVMEAQLQAAAASLRTAELNLSYTKVRAPITGLASREARSEGSLVTANSDSSLLTRIVQLEPLYVEFAAPEAEVAAVRAAWTHQKNKTLPVQVENEAGQSAVARLSFIDNAVEASSGTVRMRAVLDNRQHNLWPGEYVRVRFDEMSLTQAISVPRSAVLSSAQGYTIWVVDAKNNVQSRAVKLGMNVGDAVLISSGLQVGERYVRDGLYKVQAGSVVKPAPTQLIAPASPSNANDIAHTAASET